MTASPRHDVVVVGGGIVGFAVLHELLAAGHTSVALVEREDTPGTHQTGRNSNVIHSGLYYAPGSLKARLAVAGCAETKAFCAEHDLPWSECGKVVVATEDAELPRMAELVRRGRANGVEVTELDEAGVREREPAVAALAGLWVPSTGICDYARDHADARASSPSTRGATVHTGRAVTVGDPAARATSSCTPTAATCSPARSWCARACAPTRSPAPRASTRACASCRSAASTPTSSGRSPTRSAGSSTPCPTRRSRSSACTPRAGSTGRCTSARTRCSRWPARATTGGRCRCASSPARWPTPGSSRSPAKQWRYGLGEMYRSLSKRAMAAAVARMLPGVTADDLQPPHDVARRAGVRAQAVRPDGSLVDDFLFVQDGDAADGPAVLHVLNAPSPAATAALPIGREIVARLEGRSR